MGWSWRLNIAGRMTVLSLHLLFLLPFLDAAPSNHQLHTLMTDAEKEFYFGEAAPAEYEVIEVFRPKSESKDTRDVHFHASGQQFKLQMEPNKRLLAPQAMIVKRTHGSFDKAGNMTGDDDLARVETEEDCHYLHKDNDTVAALNLCSDSDTTGIVISAKRTLEILSLNSRLKRMMDVWKDDNSTEPKNERNSRESKSLFQKRNLHLVKRTEHKHTPKFDIHMKQEANGDFDDDVMFDTRNSNLTETKEKRRISKRGGIFSSYVSSISKSGEGVQVQHSDDRLWQACAIYCKRSDTGGWYTPRLELNDLPISPYFPDGTFCHDDGSTKYYCQKHMCLEKDSRVARNDSPDLNLPMNAAAEGEDEIPELLGKYFSLDPDKKPIGGEYYGQDKEQDENEWEVKD